VADEDDGAYSRAPQVDDLVKICRSLNEAGARYLLIGGFAVIAHGAGRTTRDIDFLVDASPANVARIKTALGVLADNAAAEVDTGDLERYSVVRVADEVIVDLIGKACGVEYDDAVRDRDQLEIDDVVIPLASKRTLIRTKNTVRPTDAADTEFLRAAIEAEETNSEGG
jgi:hypothetical protein